MPDHFPPSLLNLLDRYQSGELTEDELHQLETLLTSSPELREFYLDYSQHHHDLHVVMNSLKQNDLALRGLQQSDGAKAAASKDDVIDQNRLPVLEWRVLALFTLATSLLVGTFLYFTMTHQPTNNIAWLTNAQNCDWVEGAESLGSMQPGTRLKLNSGLAEVRFGSGANLILQGPAELVLISEMKARIVSGQLAVRVPDELSGFEIVAPNGRIIDLGTEFGVAVGQDGATEVVVFDGSVKAFTSNGSNSTTPVLLKVNQTAKIDQGRVVRDVDDDHVASEFAREIVAPKQFNESIHRFDFAQNAVAGLRDQNGRQIGLDSRLPGTGSELEDHDNNLELDVDSQMLHMTTTRSDINRQVGLPGGEYLGVKLSDFGFTGEQDFTITATIFSTPLLEDIGQFGLYAGISSDQNIRGGFLNWGYEKTGHNMGFLVNNEDGLDQNGYQVGLLSAGDDLRLTLSRMSGKYSLRVENLSDGGQSTLEIKHPEFLDGQTDLHVGMFGANPFSDARKRISINEFTVTIWLAK